MVLFTISVKKLKSAAAKNIDAKYKQGEKELPVKSSVLTLL